jgi:hypothetical protein
VPIHHAIKEVQKEEDKVLCPVWSERLGLLVFIARKKPQVSIGIYDEREPGLFWKIPSSNPGNSTPDRILLIN